MDPCMDPIFCISVDIHQLFQQHLNGNDVKSAFKVSTQWYAFFVSSPTAMRRLNFRVKYPIATGKVQEILSSSRCYSNLVLYKYCSRDILVKFAASLVYLKVLEVDREFDFDGVCFPKLQILEIGRNIDTELVYKLIVSLKSQRQLKELSFIEPRDFFYKDISSLCNLQLKKLKLGRVLVKDLQRGIYIGNIVRLIKSQTASLQYLEMKAANLAILQLAFTMDIKVLDIRVYSWLHFEKLPINTSIVSAKFDTNYCMDKDYYQLLAKLPNLTRLFQNKMTEENLKRVLGTSKKLKEILYTNCHWDGDITKFYKRLKNTNLHVNRSIKLKRVHQGFEFRV